MGKIIIRLGDITKVTDVDAIIIAANESLFGGFGVAGTVHMAAGKGLDEECKTLNGCETGQAKITDAYNLKCKKIIHTVGPKWKGGYDGECELLKKCYESSLNLAAENGLGKIAFSSIATGFYKFPVELAAKIAIDTVRNYMKKNPKAFDEVHFILYDEKTKEAYLQTDNYRYLQLSLDVKIVEYDSIIEALKNELKGQEDSEVKIKTLELMNKYISDRTKDNLFALLEYVFKIKWIKEIIIETLEKKIFSKIAMESAHVKTLAYKKKTDKSILLCIGVENYDYSEIFRFIIKELNGIKREEVSSIAVPAIKVLEETLSDDIKDTLIMKLINGSGEGICRLTEKTLKEQYGIDVALENLQCQSGVFL